MLSARAGRGVARRASGPAVCCSGWCCSARAVASGGAVLLGPRCCATATATGWPAAAVLRERAASAGRGVGPRAVAQRAVARARPRRCSGSARHRRAAALLGSASCCSARGLLLAPGVARAVAPASARHRRAAALLGSASCCSVCGLLLAPGRGGGGPRRCSGPRVVARHAGCCSRPAAAALLAPGRGGGGPRRCSGPRGPRAVARHAGCCSRPAARQRNLRPPMISIRA